MNIKRLLKSLGIGAAALVVVTFLYGQVTGPISEANTTAEFDKLLKENKQVVVEFFSPTCPVCNAFKNKGIFVQTAQALPHVKFAMTSSVQGESLHHEYNIKSFPTFIFFVDGKEIKRFEGYVDNPMFTHKVTDIFSKTSQEKG